MPNQKPILEEVLFEFRPLGHYVKVSAIDPKTGTEISIAGDRKASNEELKRIAIRKLQYVIDKQYDEPREAPDRDKNLY
ncbi:MAG: serine hydroxymethyltransferase [Proteobacteria bacterium]|nr:serine hydroxymethyltransferase [Pseudomonadota bacterium]